MFIIFTNSTYLSIYLSIIKRIRILIKLKSLWNHWFDSYAKDMQ